MQRMAKKQADFVDAMMEKLIQRVSTVMPLADKLLQDEHINSEAYAEIKAASTKQKKMRELYNSLNNQTSKAAFYESLKKYEGDLLEELEEEYRSQADSNVGDSEGTSGNSTSGTQFLEFNTPKALAQSAAQHSQSGPSSTCPSSWESSPAPLAQNGSQSVDNETRTNLKERWQRNSNKHRTKFEDLLKDHELKSLGNGKLFLCTKSEYKIGSGAEGTHVYIGMRDDGTEVAVKRMIKDNHKQLKDEMNMLRHPRLEHKNIVKYLDFTEDQDFYYLCLQLCEYNFEEYKKAKELDQDALKKVIKEVLLGLQALHNACIIHRDLKPSNILIDVEENARLADFGISRMLNQDASTVHTSRTGTRGWEATEILKGNADGMCRYKTSTDIQVAGMLVYYILSGGNHPFCEEEGFGPSYKVEENIRNGKYHLDERTDVEAKDLIEKMVALEPQNRLSVKETVEHPYFWNDEGRDIFLRIIGDKEPVQNYKDRDAKPCEALEKYKKFFGWKSKIKDLLPRERNISDDFRGLLRFLRNRLVHQSANFYENSMYKDLFPEFYISANQLAKEMGWKT